MKKLFVTLLFTSAFVGVGSALAAPTKRLNLADEPWAQSLKAQAPIVNICGSPNITVSKHSLRKDFFLGSPIKGYVLSDLLSYDEYWKILKEQNLEPAKLELEKRFQKAMLWEVSRTGEVQSLGVPAKVEIAFTATVRDCIEGAATTLGSDCSKNTKAAQREQCCREKFVGPQVFWKSKRGDIQLKYSPDPSVMLNVPGEEAHRYCFANQTLTIQ